MDGKNSNHSQTIWLPVWCHYPISQIGLVEPTAFSSLTAACFLFLITKIAFSKNTLYLLALALDFVFSSSQLDNHKQQDNEKKIVHIKFMG